jgi:hypothetical protein
MPRRLLGLSFLAIACHTAPANTPEPARRSEAAPSWCSAVERAVSGADTRGFHCLSVPNFLLTGFYGPEQNPERSDFLNACFGGDDNAAKRLRLSVRPAGSLRFHYAVTRELGASAGLDLGFLGPWAPRIDAAGKSAGKIEIDVTLEDAELRVLSSVGEILGQELSGAAPESALRRTLETCIESACDGGQERLVYTAKVLAAVPVITLRSREARELSLAASAGTARFEVDREKSSQSMLVLRAKDKLNVAALLEAAGPAFQRTGTCKLVRAERTRRRVLSELRDLGLRTLSGRALDDVGKAAEPLRQTLDQSDEAFSDAERGILRQALEAIEAAARQLALPKPNNSLCAARTMAQTVLTGSEDASPVHGLLVDVTQPLHERLTELANEHGLPCADPVWFLDLDRDGYGDKDKSVRASKQPPGHVANSLDCYDQNPEAHPGQARFFAQHRGDGSFDYDCDGKEAKREDVISGGCRQSTMLGIPTRCWADPGWQGAVPECGRQGKWLAQCEVHALSCGAAQEPRRVQECR